MCSTAMHRLPLLLSPGSSAAQFLLVTSVLAACSPPPPPPPPISLHLLTVHSSPTGLLQEAAFRRVLPRGGTLWVHGVH